MCILLRLSFVALFFTLPYSILCSLILVSLLTVKKKCFMYIYDCWHRHCCCSVVIIIIIILFYVSYFVFFIVIGACDVLMYMQTRWKSTHSYYANSWSQYVLLFSIIVSFQRSLIDFIWFGYLNLLMIDIFTWNVREIKALSAWRFSYASLGYQNL